MTLAKKGNKEAIWEPKTRKHYDPLLLRNNLFFYCQITDS